MYEKLIKIRTVVSKILFFVGNPVFIGKQILIQIMVYKVVIHYRLVGLFLRHFPKVVTRACRVELREKERIRYIF